jgi:hypothetical protein
MPTTAHEWWVMGSFVFFCSLSYEVFFLIFSVNFFSKLKNFILWKSLNFFILILLSPEFKRSSCLGLWSSFSDAAYSPQSHQCILLVLVCRLAHLDWGGDPRKSWDMSPHQQVQATRASWLCWWWRSPTSFWPTPTFNGQEEGQSPGGESMCAGRGQRDWEPGWGLYLLPSGSHSGGGVKGVLW